MPAAMEMIKNGKLRAIAVSGESRYKDLPDVPTVKESGYAEYVNYAWASLYVRADTPDNITKMLADAMQTTLHTQATKDFIAKNGSEIMPYTPEAMRTYQNEEIMRFRKIAQSAGIKPQ
jgi:tripartite-type tricarboxylate transporter receptor subunit TctC